MRLVVGLIVVFSASPLLAQSIDVSANGAVEMEANGAKISTSGVAGHALGTDAAGAAAAGDTIKDQKRTSPIECVGNRTMVIERVEVVVEDGPALIVAGNCNLRIVDSKLQGKVAIQASGNANIKIVGSTLKGKKLAAALSGNVTVEAKATKVRGKVRKSGNVVFRRRKR
jgi:glutamate synthase domain-containing protein 3